MRSQRSGTPLPTPVTSLIGRDHEVLAVLDLLNDPNVRLITLTGPGGVGKTRLAIDIATSIAQKRPDDIAYVELATVSNPDLVAQTIAQTIGIRLSSNRSALDRLVESLRDRNLFLVLDNFEHLIGAAADLVELLTTCPRVTMLITSRAVLNVSGEHIVPVTPLRWRRMEEHCKNVGDEPEEQSYSDAERLFIERATAINPFFAVPPESTDVIAHICGRLDGLPLAIEMAAAKSYLFTPEDLLERLDNRLPMLTGGARDLPARQRTMRDTIAWSYELLSPEEQTVLSRLSVFVGEWTLDSATEVCWDSEVEESTRHSSIVPIVESLVRQSMVSVATSTERSTSSTGPLFRLLETIREFADVELFKANDIDPIRTRHATYYASVAARLEPIFWGDEPGDARSIMSAELGNYRAALDWSLDQKLTDTALRLVGSIFDPEATQDLARFMGQDTTSLLEFVEKALALPGGSDDARIAALCKASQLADASGDSSRALQYADDALELARLSKNHKRLANSAYVRGRCAFRSGDLDRARQSIEVAIHDYSKLGQRGKAAWAECILASTETVGVPVGAGPDHPDLKRAVERCDAATAVFRKTGHNPGISRALGGKAYALYKQGDWYLALELLHELLGMAWEENRVLLSCLEDIADIAAKVDELTLAARLYGVVDTDRRTFGQVVPPVFQAEVDAEAESVRRDLGDAEFTRLFEAGAAMPIEIAIAESLAFAESFLAPDSVELTPREQDILPLLVEDLTAQEIADRLFLSRRTIEFHTRNLYSKLGVHSRAEAVDTAREAGLLT